MLTSDDCKSGVMYSTSKLVNHFDNDIQDDITNLNLTHDYKDNILGQTYSNDNNITDNSIWLSGLGESCGSCETTKTFICDPYNSYITNDILDYSFDSNTISNNRLSSDDLGLPLVNYFNNNDCINVNQSYSHNISPLVLNKNYKQSYNGNNYKSNNTFILQQQNNNTKLQYHRKNIISNNKTTNVFLKILATQLISGTIIGRGGKGLNWFRRKSKVDDIILSMPWEVYPKTEYRTLLLKGSLKSVIKATCIIADLMSSKYSITTDERMMVMVVLPEIFLTAMEEIKRNTNQTLMSITLFRDDTAQHQEIVALLKGDKNKIKDLIADLSISIAETVVPEKYCFVSYPTSEVGDCMNAHVSDSGSDGIKKAEWPLTDSNVTQKSIETYTHDSIDNDNVESLFSDWKDNIEESGDTVSISTITSIIRNKPEVLKLASDIKVQIVLTIPDLTADDIRTFSVIYNCEIIKDVNEVNGIQECKLIGSLDGCLAIILLMLSRLRHKL